GGVRDAGPRGCDRDAGAAGGVDVRLAVRGAGALVRAATRRGARMSEWTMSAALNRALGDALDDDPRVLAFGEDVGRSGGVFRVTDGLGASYGAERVFDTPISEAGIIGAAVGLCFAGWRPVVELQFDAFSYPAFEQVVDHVAKMRMRVRGRVDLPLT